MSNKINNLFIELSKELIKEKEELEKGKEELEKDKCKFMSMSKRIEQINESEPITLYIGSGGNNKYITRVSVLKRFPDSFFGVMFSGRHPLKEFNNKPRSYFIDRDGDYFNFILNYLRGDKILIPKDNFILKKLIIDCKFYMLPELEEKFKQEYLKINSNYHFNNKNNNNNNNGNNNNININSIFNKK
ncbi:hypothetical protein ACTFIR_011160 [Dictyostelium discoideum]